MCGEGKYSHANSGRNATNVVEDQWKLKDKYDNEESCTEKDDWEKWQGIYGKQGSNALRRRIHSWASKNPQWRRILSMIRQGIRLWLLCAEEARYLRRMRLYDCEVFKGMKT